MSTGLDLPAPNRDRKNPFRSAQNVYLTQSLFVEHDPGRETCMYTLKDRDYEGYPSLHRLYLEANDPTEYLFAQTYLDGYDHWVRMYDSYTVRPYIDRWRRDLAVKIKAEALARVIEKSKGDSKESFAAQRYLIDNDFVPGQTGKKGRPSKADIKAKAEAIFLDKAQSSIEDDFSRILGPSGTA